MLVECPRCHFKQPQDQYCASCGVDMLSFKRKEDPALGKILQSGLFQFLMVVLLGIGVTYFVIRADQPQQWIQKINRFSSFKANSNPANKSTEAGIPEDTASDQASYEAPPPPTWSARSAAPQATASESTEMAQAISVGEGETVSDTTRVAITMYEVDAEYINSLYQQSQNNGMMTADSGGIKVFTTTATSLGSARVLKSAKEILTAQTMKEFKSGATDMGLVVQLTYLGTKDGIIGLNTNVGKLHASDNAFAGAEPRLRKTDRVIFFGSALLSYLETENALANTPPFQIFQSPDFRSQKTTFAIMIAPE